MNRPAFYNSIREQIPFNGALKATRSDEAPSFIAKARCAIAHCNLVGRRLKRPAVSASCITYGPGGSAEALDCNMEYLAPQEG